MKIKSIALKLFNFGSFAATVIGFPVGLCSASACLCISLFPPFNFGLALIGGKVFWQPWIFLGCIPTCYLILLCIAGSKIEGNLDKKLSLNQISYRFTSFINLRLAILIAILFIIGNIFFEIAGGFSIIATFVSITLTFILFALLNLITTPTIGIWIVKATQKNFLK